MALETHHMEYLNEVFEAAEVTPIEQGYGNFDQWSYDFIMDQKQRFDQYDAETRFSSKQWEVIFRIGRKLGVAQPRTGQV